MGLQNTLKALSDPIRRDILGMLKNGRMSAGEITEHFEVTGASVSRHLSVLKDADLIRDERDGVSFLKLGGNDLAARALVMLIIAYHRLLYFKVIEKFYGDSGILCGNKINFFKSSDCSGRKIT